MEIQNNKCPICSNEVNEINVIALNNFYIDCPRCGVFELSNLSITTTNLDTITNARAVVSHWIRQHQGNEEVKILRSLLGDIIANNKLPTPKEQADNLLFYLGEQANKPSETIDAELLKTTSIIGSVHQNDVKYYLSYLQKENFIVMENPSSEHSLLSREFDVFATHLTMRGWEKHNELKKTYQESTTAFMAMKFGINVTDNLFKTILKPAVEETGFELKKLDDKAPAGSIDNRLRVEIRKAKFLIADLTHDNPGAYFESGFAEGLGKPVIYICEMKKFKKHKTHFDTNHHLTLKWDMENLDDFKEQLKATIRVTFPEDAKMEDG